MTTGNISSAAASVLLLLMKMTKATKTPGDQLREPRVGGRRKGGRPLRSGPFSAWHSSRTSGSMRRAHGSGRKHRPIPEAESEGKLCVCV